MNEATAPGPETTTNAAAADARQSERIWLNIAGLMVYGSDALATRGQKSFPCTIANLSDGGAMVRLPPLCDPQKDVILVNLTQGVVYQATVIWRRPSRCGLKFGRQYFLNRLPEELKFLEPMTRER